MDAVVDSFLIVPFKELLDATPFLAVPFVEGPFSVGPLVAGCCEPEA